ncbi:MAG: hypothetical protein NC408_05950 [Candidatus Gastranaerophilales bacterium]|nr:hypothetical protein [Candidatus Gastranaerophilales bacterium]MCM1072415.1 hypothetical protein [Bacteroides sp.]
MTNFNFLKKIDNNLYNIITEAEKLYRDEYFEQCMVQTRKFGENICKNVIGTRCTPESTFDEMLATLKDKIKSEQEKEFIDDLYFLKKQGNSSAHSSTVKKEGMLALECLQRSFEAAINYAVYYTKANSNILKLQYDIDLLITGEKSKKSLTEKYKEGRKQTAKPKKQSYTMKSKSTKKKEGLSAFQILLIVSFIISGLVILSLIL